MANSFTANTLGTADQLYDWATGGAPWRPVQPPRIVPVGNTSGLVDAVANALPGDVIEIVEPGVYQPDTLVTQVPNLTIRGHADAEPTDIVLRGRGMNTLSYGGAPHGIYSQYPGLTLQNFTIEQFIQQAVTFGAGAESPIFQDMVLRDCGQQFIKASAFPAAINYGLVERVVFEYTAGRPSVQTSELGYFYSGFIDVHNSVGWIVRDFVCKEMTPTQAEIDAVLAAEPGATMTPWSPAVYFWNGSSNTIVERGIFHNCARMVALGLMDRFTSNGYYDHVGGIVRNCMGVIDAGRLSAAQTAESDGGILLWNSPGAKALNNTILTNGQVADAVQGRWSPGLEISNNLTDNSIRMRNGASYSGSGNQLNALPEWFVNSATANLRLNATGNAAVNTAPRLLDCMYDIDNTLRANPTKIGAHRYG